MYMQRDHGHGLAVVLGAMFFALGAAPSLGLAQVTADTSAQGNLSTAVTAGPNYNITGGTRPGGEANLFHGFQSFSIGPAEVANFINDSALPTTNILSRVTGGSASNIFGTIQTTGFPGANLFLMNPSGILFGPTAQLNVEGSFHATTADYLKLGNNGIFYADTTQVSVLTSAPPSAFGFLSANPAAIDVQAGNFAAFPPLLVPLGETLSFVGGTLNIGATEVRNAAGDIVADAKPAGLAAPAGRINLVSVASPGEATFNSPINVDGFATLGDVNINGGYIFGGALMLPTYIDAKEVFIRGGQLAMNNGLIWPAFFSGFGLGPRANGGEVNIAVRGSASITGTDVEPILSNAPGIFTLTGRLGGPPEALPDAKGPDVTIQADSLTVSGVAAIQTLRAGPGVASDVTVSADTVTVQNGGSISLFNLFAGDGGTLTVNARVVNLSGDGTPSPTGNTGLFTQNLIHPCFGCASFDPRLTFADAGAINVNATERVNVTGDAVILTDSFGLGRGGDITVNTGDLTITGTGDPFSAGILAQSPISGDAGNITINASGTVEIQNGGRIAGNTFGTGNGSNVTINAGTSVTFTGADSRITNATGPLPVEELDRIFGFQLGISFTDLLALFALPPDASLFDLLTVLNGAGIFVVPDATPGDAGTTTVNTPVLTLNADTRILASTGWDGDAGTIMANVGSLFVNNGGAIDSRSGIEALDGGLLLGTGDAGAVTVTATDAISVSGAGSTISTSTLGGGAGGTIDLTAANQVLIENGGSVTADSFGTGLTGNINITSADSITLDGGTISTRAVTSDGGNINLFAPNIVYLNNSQITTSVESGVGAGGNILIDPQFVILNNSSIIANAFGGPGGNITIIADNFLSSALSVVEASSALSTPGVIQIVSPDNNVESSIQVLTAAFLDASSQLRGLCSARRTGAPSSFTVASRGGVPVEADGYLPSFGTDAATGTAGMAGPTYADAGSAGAQPITLALVMPDSLDCMR